MSQIFTDNLHFSVPNAISMDTARFPEGKIVGSISVLATQENVPKTLPTGKQKRTFFFFSKI
jgi:hypothetical protein